MFIQKYIFDKLTGVYESNIEISRKQTEIALDRILAAKDFELKAILAAKDAQIAFLQTELNRQIEWVNHERARAEAAIDQLIVRDGQAGPIRHADLQRDQAAREAAGESAPLPKNKEKVLADIFSQVNDVLGEEGEEMAPDERIAHIGGHPLPA